MMIDFLLKTGGIGVLLTGEPRSLAGGLVLATHSRGVMWPTTVSQNAPSRGISDVVSWRDS